MNPRGNFEITKVNHMTKIKELDACGYYCGIDDEGIKDLSLEKLEAYDNKKITKKWKHKITIK